MFEVVQQLVQPFDAALVVDLALPVDYEVLQPTSGHVALDLGDHIRDRLAQ